MVEFRDKVIYLISGEDWGEMLFSKHHYAIELAKRGNRVYFISPPDRRRNLARGEIQIEGSGFENLFIVKSRLRHPFFLKYKAANLYRVLTGWHVRRLVKKIGEKPEVLWSFDLNYALPTDYFPRSSIYIYMPVDGPFNHKDEKRAAIRSNAIFSVTEEILAAYRDFPQPKHFINHGVADVFISQEVKTDVNHPLRIGYSGSLLRSEIDRETLRKIIEGHPDKVFEFWGEFDFRYSSVHLAEDCDNAMIRGFVEFLQSCPNVKLHGPVRTSTLAECLQRMDAFLICYDNHLDQSKGTNFHKVLEFLGTGKVVISNNISTYHKKFPGMIQMIDNHMDNSELVHLFKKVTDDIRVHNSVENQKRRIDFARGYCYAGQVSKIESLINNREH